MSARYLIRLDDASHHMDRSRWERVERVLDAHDVKPIVAVIPDNRDPKLMIEPGDPGFWERVRSWVAKDWTVALHGLTHLMHATQDEPILPFYRRSEFAGLALEEQAAKIRVAWRLFLAQGIEPQVWVAPAHSFDLLTLEALRRETPIRLISDGIAWDSYQEHDLYWIPQQLWALRARPWGLWTVCLHPNTMGNTAIAALDDALGGEFRGRVINVSDVALGARRKTSLERLYQAYFWWRWARAQRRMARAR